MSGFNCIHYIFRKDYNNDLHTHNSGKTIILTDLSTLDFGDESIVLELHPVGLVEFGSNEEVEVLDLVVFSHKSGRQPQLGVCLHHCTYTDQQCGT